MCKKRILLVDDEAGFTTLLELCLDQFEVCGENNGLKAIETARRFKPDLIFLDVIMPDIDGRTIAEQMKADPVLEKIPIVFITATVSDNEELSRQKLGDYPALPKPASRQQILACIATHLGT